MGLYFRGYESDVGRGAWFPAKSTSPSATSQQAQAYEGMASGSFKLDLRGGKPRGLLMQKGRASPLLPTLILSCPDLCPPRQDFARQLAGASVFWSPRNWAWPRPARLAPPYGTGPGSGRSHVHLLRPRETTASGGECPLDMTPYGTAAFRSGSSWEGIPKVMSDS